MTNIWMNCQLPQIEMESFEKKMSNILYVSARSVLFLQITVSGSVTFQHKIHYINFDWSFLLLKKKEGKMKQVSPDYKNVLLFKYICRGAHSVSHKRKITVFCRRVFWRSRAHKTNVLRILIFISVTVNWNLYFSTSASLLCEKSSEKDLTIFPSVHSCNDSLTPSFSFFLPLSPQKGHINNMLCSFDADGRLKVSV